VVLSATLLVGNFIQDSGTFEIIVLLFLAKLGILFEEMSLHNSKSQAEDENLIDFSHLASEIIGWCKFS